MAQHISQDLQIGPGVQFQEGYLANRFGSIRAELEEIQAPVLGRKFVRRDRRPLEPPPVVQLKLFETHLSESGEFEEREFNSQELEWIENGGMICMVDLFEADTRQSASDAGPSSSMSRPPRENPQPVLTGTDVPQDVVRVTPQAVTSLLVGTTFVQPIVLTLTTRPVLLCAFPDLSVTTEGTFYLRYRVFDIFSKPLGHENPVIQAECYGLPFINYATKEFPGLPQSTELTKKLVEAGIQANIRDLKRNRKKQKDPTGQHPLQPRSIAQKVDEPPEDSVHLSFLGGTP